MSRESIIRKLRAIERAFKESKQPFSWEKFLASEEFRTTYSIHAALKSIEDSVDHCIEIELQREGKITWKERMVKSKVDFEILTKRGDDPWRDPFRYALDNFWPSLFKPDGFLTLLLLGDHEGLKRLRERPTPPL